MGLFSRKSRGRYYLLPGMGGRLARKKGRWAMKVGLSIGLIVAALVGLIIYLTYL